MSSSESVVPESDSSSCGETASLLDRLRSPPPSVLSRKRQIPSNPPKGLKRGKGVTASKPQNVTATTRVREFPVQCLSVVSNKLRLEVRRQNWHGKTRQVCLHPPTLLQGGGQSGKS